MAHLNPDVVAGKLRAVVGDEPKAFAYDVGVSLSAVYNYLNGRIPTTEVLYRIARHTGRPMEWFLEEPKAATPSVVARETPERRAA